eukprot:gene5506-168_t
MALVILQKILLTADLVNFNYLVTQELLCLFVVHPGSSIPFWFQQNFTSHRTQLRLKEARASTHHHNDYN